MFFSYTKSDFDCEYIALNPLIFKSVYTRHNVSSDVIVGVFWRGKKSVCMVQTIATFTAKTKDKLPQKQSVIHHKLKG